MIEDDDPYDRPDLYERGRGVWHSSEEDGGPDVGVSVGLGNGYMLYAGELPNSEAEWAKTRWGLKLYSATNDRPSITIGPVDSEDGRRLVELVEFAIRNVVETLPVS